MDHHWDFSTQPKARQGEMMMRAASSVLKVIVATVLAGTAIPAAAAPAEGAGSARPAKLEEITVTAQKREQNLQAVPIAVTAITGEQLKSNRIQNITDISAVTPNLTVQTTSGGMASPTFAMRGVVAQGSMAGQDKSLGVYLDGVQIASPYGQIFDMPVMERLEVLRGPQGTLFGRNSNAGALAVSTRDPTGQFGFQQDLTAGNYNEFRSSTLVETPSWGPFSALLNFLHDERDGDIRNLGAGTVWDRRVAGLGTAVSSKTLGAKNENAWFFAAKYEPSSEFKMVYKYDHLENDYTAEGTGVVAFTGTNPGLVAAYNANPPPTAGTKRPNAVNNFYIVPGSLTVEGHNLRLNWRISDGLALQNIVAYRHSDTLGFGDSSGLGGLRTPSGDPYVAYNNQNFGNVKQWSDELQLNYRSRIVTLTAGVDYYDVHTRMGGPPNLAQSIFLTVVPGGVFTARPSSYDDVTAKSLAGYAQAELHATQQLDFVLGGRYTNDKKEGTNVVTGTPYPWSYDESHPSYLTGVNYKLSDDVLLYAKYSTSFVSGGMVANIEYKPEDARSLELGVKAEMLDQRLRMNLAVFDADYKNLQKVTSGSRIGRPDLVLALLTEGDEATRGVELEVTAMPTDTLTLQANYGYTDWDLTNINPLLGTSATFKLPYQAHTTAGLSAQYRSEPLFSNVGLMARLDANYQGDMREIPRLPIPVGHESVEFSPARWILNGRVALQNIELSKGGLEVALWGRNLLNNKDILWVNSLKSTSAAATYQAARTFGLDVTYKY